MDKNILTIATGKDIYVQLALNLFLSFLKWHKNTTIKFYLVTDREDLIPQPYLQLPLHILAFTEGSIGNGFYPKICLDRFAPNGQTLFIDSDCLIFENMEWVFEKFKGKNVSVVGNYISNGEWFGDIKTICEKLNVNRLPKFNGGIYYLENGDEAKKVYETARRIEKKYDELGFVRFRNHPADELIMASALAIHQQHPLADEGNIMSDPQACPGQYSIDVIRGFRELNNPAFPHPLHQSWYPFEKVRPAVVHFLGFYTEHYPYQREVLRLRKFIFEKLTMLDEIGIKLKMEYPKRTKETLKKLFRPIYHLLFGIRKLRTSERL